MYFLDLIADLIQEDNDLFMYNDTDKGVVVIFVLPPVKAIERLYDFIVNGVVSSYDADDIIWDMCVKHHECPSDLLDPVKAIISNFVFFMGVDIDTSLLVRKINFVTSQTERVSDMLRGTIVGLNFTDYEQTKNMTPFELYHYIVLAHSKAGIELSETLDKLNQMFGVSMPVQTAAPEHVAPQQQATAPPPPPAPGQRVDVNKAASELKNQGGMRYYERVDSPAVARRHPVYKSIFSILDKISSGELSQEDIERLNPKVVIGGNKEIINGQIVDDEEIAAAPRRKVRFKTNISS